MLAPKIRIKSYLLRVGLRKESPNIKSRVEFWVRKSDSKEEITAHDFLLLQQFTQLEVILLVITKPKFYFLGKTTNRLLSAE